MGIDNSIRYAMVIEFVNICVGSLFTLTFGKKISAEENNDNVTVVLRNSSLPPFAMQQPEGDITVSRFRRSGSERLRDGAKAFLRRVESLKSKRRKQKNREGVIISGPQVNRRKTIPTYVLNLYNGIYKLYLRCDLREWFLGGRCVIDGG